MPSNGYAKEESKDSARGAGVFRAAINVTKCFIGAASFELPWAFAEAGVIGSIVGVLGLAILSSFSLNRLAACSELVQSQDARAQLRVQLIDEPADCKRRAPTFPEVGQAAFGTAGKLVAWFGVVAMSLGVCGSYLVFLSKTMAELVPALDATEWLLVTLPLMMLMSWYAECCKPFSVSCTGHSL